MVAVPAALISLQSPVGLTSVTQFHEQDEVSQTGLEHFGMAAVGLQAVLSTFVHRQDGSTQAVSA